MTEKVTEDDARATFIFGHPANYYAEFILPQAVDAQFLPLIENYKNNLSSAFTVANVPFEMAQAAVLNLRFQRVLTAERIRALSLEDESDEIRGNIALTRARERFISESTPPDAVATVARETLQLLRQHLEQNAFRSSANELLRQVLVLGQGAFEILCNDCIRFLLNAVPSLAVEISNDRVFRDNINHRVLINALALHNFDLSKRMGDVFCDAVRIDSLERIREVLAAVLRDSSLDGALKAKCLWRIAKQRNLIVHQRGVVDARYLAATGSAAQVGEQLLLTSSEVERYLVVLRDVGNSTIAAANRRLIAGLKPNPT